MNNIKSKERQIGGTLKIVFNDCVTDTKILSLWGIYQNIRCHKYV